MIYVLFHANCFDGTGAKYAAWKHFGDRAQYIPVQYGQPFPEIVPLAKESEVYIIDFSYSREVLEDVYDKVGTLVVLDHHKTAEEALKGLEYAKFDMAKSGAVMAWEYFHPGKPVPLLLLHVQDGDLWKFRLNRTKDVRAALPMLESSMERWDVLCNPKATNAWEFFLDQGRTIVTNNDREVKFLANNRVTVLPYKGYKAGVYNTTVLISEAGNTVCKERSNDLDFSMSYFIDQDGTPVVSFRSIGDMDVSVLAKELQGGGHKNAAGARVTMQFLSDLYAGKL
jgi:nanoRNase/pAp phosphatase (c-di-AMP/oligoRNAs hydrolase)